MKKPRLCPSFTQKDIGLTISKIALGGQASCHALPSANLLNRKDLKKVHQNPRFDAPINR